MSGDDTVSRVELHQQHAEAEDRAAFSIATADCRELLALARGNRELLSALDDLADAARSACDARRHTELIDALAEADRLTLRVG